ncbi:MAG: TonB-dependent receptor [Opitutaceae bacterium]|jgi:outer membrane receptor protein involved in Fe transport|nr:TonB-dependent receptor [Opitutaceae bacterium]
MPKHPSSPRRLPLIPARLLPGGAVAFLAAAGLAAAVTAGAQTVPPPPPPAAPPPAEEEVVILSVFEVREGSDDGYSVGRSTAGGRTDAPIEIIPSAISQLSRQFLDDLGISDMLGASEWSVNSVPQYSNPNPFDYAVNLRSMSSNNFASRNYFRWYFNSDNYNTERIEFARGPNGVIFGDGNAAGIVTTFTKRARFDKPRYAVRLRTDSFGGYRFTADVNQPVTKDVALRVNYLNMRQEDWRDNDPFHNHALHLAGAWRIGKNTALRAEGELSRGVRHLIVWNFIDIASMWDGSTVFKPVSATDTPSGGGIAKMSSSNTYYVFAPALHGYSASAGAFTGGNPGVLNWQNFYATQGTLFALRPEGDPRIPNIARLSSRELNTQPPDVTQTADLKTYSVYLDHSFLPNLNVQLALNHMDIRLGMDNCNTYFASYTIDVNYYRPAGALAGTVSPTDAARNEKFLVPYTDNTIDRFPSSGNGNIVDDYRLLATWSLENNWIKQRFSAITGYREDNYRYLQERFFLLNNGRFYDTADAVRIRMYWDEPGAYPVSSAINYMQNLGGANRFGFVPVSTTLEKNKLQYNQLLSITQLFNDSLTISLGARYDKVYKHLRYVYSGPAVITTTTPTEKFEDDPVSKNAGAVWFPVNWLGVYANYSETFLPPNSGPPFMGGTGVSISRSEGSDFGIKLRLLRGKIKGVINYYDITQNNDAGIGGSTNIMRSEINNIWSAITGETTTLNQYRDTQDYHGKGWEFDFTAQPTRNIRMTFNLALPRTEAINLLPRLRAYVAENRDFWEQQEALLASSTGSTASDDHAKAGQIRTNLNMIDQRIQGLTPGTALRNTYKYTANLYTTYTFNKGPLKGTAVGLGGNFRGKAKLDSTVESAYEYLYSESYYTMSGHIAWERKLKRGTLHIQLNVDNILDNDALITTGYRQYPMTTGERMADTFRYLTPRRLSLSAGYTF